MARQMTDRIIVSAEYGSHAIGTANDDSDHDLMSVYLEPADSITGIETVNTRTGGTAAQGERSTSEDTDAVSYPLRKWATLAAAGNPTVLSLLFAPSLTETSPAWQSIMGIRSAFISKEAGRRFRGYSWGQREAMMGWKNKRTNRPELIHRFGYDTKFAYHMIRTGLQGVELMVTGGLQLPMGSTEVGMLRSIREGQIDKDAVLDLNEEIDVRLKTAIEESNLPDKADRETINATLHRIYLDEWA